MEIKIQIKQNQGPEDEGRRVSLPDTLVRPRGQGCSHWSSLPAGPLAVGQELQLGGGRGSRGSWRRTASPSRPPGHAAGRAGDRAHLLSHTLFPLQPPPFSTPEWARAKVFQGSEPLTCTLESVDNFYERTRESVNDG